ncbi:hypothetical protein C8J56DRAFT_901206 [Mycena floridula]|nr:hypothetical protein C8J56DRAFT_901206 [Mycena floridula]
MRQALASCLGQQEDLFDGNPPLYPMDRQPPRLLLVNLPPSRPPRPLHPRQNRLSPARPAASLTTLGRTTLLTLLVGGGWFIWTTQQGKHLEKQLSFDEGKKMLVAPAGADLSPQDAGYRRLQCHRHVSKEFLVRAAAPEYRGWDVESEKRGVAVIDAEVTKVDAENRTVTFADKSEIQGSPSTTTIPAEVQTFGIKGVQENACFMKEIADAGKMQCRFMDCLESAGSMGQSKDEIDSDLRGIEYENCLSFHDLGLIIGVLRVGLKQGNKTINSKDFLTRNAKVR